MPDNRLMSNAIYDLDFVVRVVGATAAVILATAMARAHGAPIIGRVCGALLACGAAAYLPCSMQTGVCASPAAVPAVLLASGVPFFFWAWTNSIMDDDFRMRPLAWMAAAALLGLPLLVRSLPFAAHSEWRIVAHSILGIAFVAAALAAVLRTWREDLVETRRRLRLLVLIVTGGYSLIVMIVELFLGDQPPTQALQLVNAFSISALLLVLSASLLGLTGTLHAAFGWTSTEIAPSPPNVQPAAVGARDPELEILDKLNTLMSSKALYRDASLTVAKLAATLGVPEKKLRLLINGRLGHKNFPSYVNAFRLEEVRLRLSKPAHDHLPILTLALDAGFGSIVVFNRVFKACYAMTPTEYRAQHQNASAN